MLPSVSDFIFLTFYASFIGFYSGSKSRLVEGKNVTSEVTFNNLIDRLNEKLNFMAFCNLNVNLNVSIFTDSDKYSVIVSFELSDSKFKDCYEYYNISLEKKRKEVDLNQVRYRYDEQKSVSHEFKNVACGTYQITIHPCYNTWQCAPYKIRYPELINMTSNECLGLVKKKKLIFEQQFEKKIIIITAVTAFLLILAVSGLMVLYYKSKHRSKTYTAVNDSEQTDFKEEESPTSNIDVYIIKYYDRNVNNKWKIKMLKDFCVLTGFYNTVKTIEDELSLILVNIDDELSRILKKRGEDGSLRKIILIASNEYEEDDAHELENIIFFKFIDKVKDNIEECLQGYDHFFIVKLDSSINCQMLEDIVRRSRFTFSDELMEDHLINLCFNLCSGSNLNMSSVERNLRNLLIEHPIRYLENYV